MPHWFRPLLLFLTAALLVGWFSPAMSDTDFWWHLKTGQYIAEKHALPVPDPFAYTTYLGTQAYAGEDRTRYFNLTHEWLTQALFYGAYRVGGFAGVVAFRAILLTLFCGLAGLISYLRSGGFYRALGATLAAAGVAATFASDRPFLFTFVFLAGTIAILESNRPRLLWLLPPILLVWANCHGGYFLGWLVLAAYARNLGTGTTFPNFAASAAASIALSGLNPNGFRILQILSYYRNSYLTSRLLEWSPTPWWPPHWYTVLLAAAIVAMLYARRRVRLVDWLLMAAFTMAAVTAYRNVVLVGLLAPIMIVVYAPKWKRPIPAILHFSAIGALVAAIAAGIAGGNFFQFRTSDWKWPSGAAGFIAANHITAPLFNTYEFGGYLMWRLWPAERVFIDGRALNESLFLDYARILYNHDATGGKSAQQLLDQYVVQAIVMNGFEATTGNIYLLAPALADPQQTDWKLVYSDAQAMVFLRQPPAGMPVLNSLAVLDHLETECDLHIQHEPQYPRCARGLGQIFSQVGDFARARRWLGTYLGLPHDPDPQAEDAYRRMLGSPR